MTTATKPRRGVQTDASEARKARVLDIIRRDGPITAWGVARKMHIFYSHVLQFLSSISAEGLALLAEDDTGKIFILDKGSL